MTLVDLAFTPRKPRLDTLSQWLARVAAAAPVLGALTVVLLLLTLPTLAAMAVDPRVFQGESVWLKPLKFEIALAIYAGTLAIYALWIPPRVRAALWFRAIVVAASLAMLAEIAWIGGAAAAGTSSHFNVSSPLMASLYQAAGIAAVTLTSLSLVFGIAIARNAATGLSPALHLSIAIGLVLTFVLTLVTAGTMGAMAGHTVGGAPGGEALPLLGWARNAGDLRVAHFFATHAMHALPVFGLAVAALFDTRRGRRAIWLGAAVYTVFVVLVFVQALSGRPFV